MICFHEIFCMHVDIFECGGIRQLREFYLKIVIFYQMKFYKSQFFWFIINIIRK